MSRVNVFDREITPAHLLIRLGAAPSAGKNFLASSAKLLFERGRQQAADAPASPPFYQPISRSASHKGVV
jgi:hypothetical protein